MLAMTESSTISRLSNTDLDALNQLEKKKADRSATKHGAARIMKLDGLWSAEPLRSPSFLKISDPVQHSCPPVLYILSC